MNHVTEMMTTATTITTTTTTIVMVMAMVVMEKDNVKMSVKGEMIGKPLHPEQDRILPFPFPSLPFPPFPSHPFPSPTHHVALKAMRSCPSLPDKFPQFPVS